MGDSGIVVFGHTSLSMVMLWAIGAIILGVILAYGAFRAGHLRRSERERLDRNTEALQQREDPYKRTETRAR